jgi:hypothetical protein
MRRVNEQQRLIELLQQTGEKPTILAELRAGGIYFPAAGEAEIELNGYAIERGMTTGSCSACVRPVQSSGAPRDHPPRAGAGHTDSRALHPATTADLTDAAPIQAAPWRQEPSRPPGFRREPATSGSSGRRRRSADARGSTGDDRAQDRQRRRSRSLVVYGGHTTRTHRVGR